MSAVLRNNLEIISLAKAEQDYCVTHRELLAVVETEFTKLRRRYRLSVLKFTVRVDHSPILSATKVKEPDPNPNPN